MPFRGQAGLVASLSSPGAPRGERMGVEGNLEWRMQLVATGIPSQDRRWRHGSCPALPGTAAREQAQPPLGAAALPAATAAPGE